MKKKLLFTTHQKRPALMTKNLRISVSDCVTQAMTGSRRLTWLSNFNNINKKHESSYVGAVV